MDRKAVRRAFKESRRPMGIYRIRHLGTGRALIGRSVDLPSVLNRARAQLRFGMHPNAALQRDWNTFGPDEFAFEVLDTLTPSDRPDYDPADDLLALKAMWLERLEPAESERYPRRPEVGR
jgi:hypothetical protein